MIRKGIKTAASAVGTTTVSGTVGTLAVTGGANAVTIERAVGSSGNALSAVTVADSTNAAFSSANDAALIATAEDVIKETDVVLGGLGSVDGADGV